MSKNRFDLEHDILGLWHTVDDIRLFQEKFLDGPEALSEDDIANHLMALEYGLKLRLEKAWDTYLQVFELDQYRDNSETYLGDT